MDRKKEHLGFIQAAINRLATQSFVLKGWSITLVAALLALAANREDKSYVLLSVVPVLVFWLLDGFFLAHERRFRSLYDKVRQQDEGSIDFSMDTTCFRSGRNAWLRSSGSATLLLFYGGLGVIVLIAWFALSC